MRCYQFYEAATLLRFIEERRDSFIGHTLVSFYTEFWPKKKRDDLSSKPIILEMDNCCISADYLITSDLLISIGSKDELAKCRNLAEMLQIKNIVTDYYEEEACECIARELIEGCKIENIEIERFTNAFMCEPSFRTIRPDGGDYFSTIRIWLSSGIKLCVCGADAVSDRYIEVWCE